MLPAGRARPCPPPVTADIPEMLPLTTAEMEPHKTVGLYTEMILQCVTTRIDTCTCLSGPRGPNSAIGTGDVRVGVMTGFATIGAGLSRGSCIRGRDPPVSATGRK